MKILALSALLLTVPAAADTPGPSFADAIGVCRSALVEQIQGGDGSKAAAALNAVPTEARDGVRVVCTAYMLGAADILTLQHANDAKAVSI